MNLMLRSGVCAMLLFAGQPASAGPFLAATGTSTTTEYSDIKRGVGFAVSAGYQLDTLPLFVEGEYYSGGKLKIEDGQDLQGNALRGGSLKFRGFQGFAGASLPIGSDARVWAKGGYYQFDGKFRADEVSGGGSTFTDVRSSGNSRGLTLGAGLDWMFLRDLGLRAEVETPMKVDLVPGSGSDETMQLTIIRLGVVWRPGSGLSAFQRGPAEGSVSPRPASAPSNPAPAAAPALPPLPAPAPAMAVVFKPGNEVLARAGTPLRATPREDSDTVQALSSATVLKLESSIVNATGTWWFASSDIERGWLRADELVSRR